VTAAPWAGAKPDAAEQLERRIVLYRVATRAKMLDAVPEGLLFRGTGADRVLYLQFPTITEAQRWGDAFHAQPIVSSAAGRIDYWAEFRWTDGLIVQLSAEEPNP
jgi:hypothetical protein